MLTQHHADTPGQAAQLCHTQPNRGSRKPPCLCRVLLCTVCCRTTSHDRCSWVLEWEGFDARERPGWMHPAVFVLTAGSYSWDMEARRLCRGQAGIAAWWSVNMSERVAGAWAACRDAVQRLRNSNWGPLRS